MRAVSLCFRRFSGPVLAASLILFMAACVSAAPTIYYPPTGGAPQPGETPQEAPPPQGDFRPNAALFICPGLGASNAPPSDASRRIHDFHPVIYVDGVVMVPVPVNDVCLTSGYGRRNGRMHDGIDLQSRPAGTIHSAAPGTILEARVSSGYGNMVIIGHGDGIFTRYAHLASFADGISAGKRIGFGQPLGLMGRSGNATAVHLHFEILTGNYNNPKRSFGLVSHDPFSFPAYVPVEAGS